MRFASPHVALAAGADDPARRRRDGVLGLHQEHRRARDDDPGRVPVRAPLGRLGVALPHADGVRLAPRRHRHAGRHLAEHHRRARAPGARRRAVPDVRLHAGRPRHRGRRRGVPDLRLRASCPTGRARSDSTRRSRRTTTRPRRRSPQSSPIAGRTVADLRKLCEDERLRRRHRAQRRPQRPAAAGRRDQARRHVLLQGEPKALDSLVAHAELRADARRPAAREGRGDGRGRRHRGGDRRRTRARRPHRRAGRALPALRRQPPRR